MDQTAICNLALMRLGITQTISSITDSNATARACNTVWEPCVRSMLRERPWPFAVRQVDLALVGQEIMSGWFFSYRYPSDFIVVNRVFPSLAGSAPSTVSITTDRVPSPQTYPFQVGSDTSARLIHTDVDDAVCEGTVYIADTGLYDPMFSSALAWYVAAETSLGLTKNPALYANAYQRYLDVTSEAFATGMNEQKPRETAEASMVQARD